MLHPAVKAPCLLSLTLNTLCNILRAGSIPVFTYFLPLRVSSMGCSGVVSSPDAVLTLNSWSVSWSARLQTALSIVKLLALALIIVPGMMLLAQGRCMANGGCSRKRGSRLQAVSPRWG